MTLVTFGPAARAEMLEAVGWYDVHALGLGDSFLAEIDAVVARLVENPRQFPVVFKDIRRARLHRFPYGLFFRVDAAGILVLACFHSNRNPHRWRERS